MMSSDAWLEQQLATELSQSGNLEKLIKLEQYKVSQARLRIIKIQEGWEKGFYTPEEVQIKLTEQREAVARAESEIVRLRGQMADRDLSTLEAELLRQELKALRDRNLLESTFEDRADLVAKLGIKILPSEDLKSRKIFCRLKLAEMNLPTASCGVSVARILSPSPLEFALQRLKTLLTTLPCDSSPQQAAGHSRQCSK